MSETISLRPNLARSSQKSVSICALVALLLCVAPASAQQVVCRCAFRPLSAFICSNELTARVRVLWGLSLPSGNRVYFARVLDVFSGSPVRDILIEAPAACGFPLRPLGTYVISVNRGDDGLFSTFQCGSFVKAWSDITPDEVATLKEPNCAPSCDHVSCAPGETCVLDPVVCVRAPCPPLPVCIAKVAGADEICYRFSETDPSVAIDRPCDADHKCVATSDVVGFNALRVCKPLDYCLNPETAPSDCAALPHQAVLGNWSCKANLCRWLAGVPNP